MFVSSSLASDCVCATADDVTADLARRVRVTRLLQVDEKGRSSVAPRHNAMRMCVARMSMSAEGVKSRGTGGGGSRDGVTNMVAFDVTKVLS